MMPRVFRGALKSILKPVVSYCPDGSKLFFLFHALVVFYDFFSKKDYNTPYTKFIRF